MHEAPDLLYYGDVPVEETSAGRLVLHRLISACEPGRWAICSSNFEPENPSANHPPSAMFSKRRHRGLRLLHTKLGPMWASILAWREWHAPSPWPVSRPHAVMTVAHGLGWIGAVARARREGVRCVVHVHDHPGASLPEGDRRWNLYAGLVRRALRAADVTLAISPSGADWLTKQTRRRDPVVFPVWINDAPNTRPPSPLKPPTLAYAGSIAYSGYRPGLVAAALAAKQAGWRMIVFPSGPVDKVLKQDMPGVVWRETVPAAQLPRILAESADYSFITTDFDPIRSDHVRVSFPSKFADYLHAGLPVLAAVPAWSSLAQLAANAPELAHVVTTTEVSRLVQTLDKLATARTINRDATTVARRFIGLANNVATLRAALDLD